jgi:HlyD family secretion protein
MKRLLQKLPAALVLLLLAGFIVYGFWPVPVEVDLATATIGQLQVTVNDDGKTRIREKYTVSAPVFGKLLRPELDEGDEVEQERTVLARIEPSDPSLLDARARAEAEARVQAAEAAKLRATAALTSAQEALALARHDFDRAGKLIDKRAISRAEFDKAEHQQHIAEANVRSAEFALKVAIFELELAKAALIRTRVAPHDQNDASTLTILSPVNGRVLRVLQESAGVMQPGDELLEIGDPRDLEMEIDVLSTDAVQIRPGAKVFVEHWGGEGTLNGTVRLVEPSAFLKVSALGVEEQRVNVIADFTDPLDQRETLGDGYRIEARIVVGEAEDVVKVPAGVLFREGDQWSVFRVVDGRARLQSVRPGKSNGLETEIVEGVDSGDTLILHPTDKIQDGVAVTPN